MAASIFRRILVPHDFSPQATVALKTAAQLAREHEGALTVLHAIVPFYVPADVPFGLAADTIPSPTAFVPEQRKTLERVVTKALGANPPPVTYRVEVGDAAQGLTEVQQRGGAAGGFDRHEPARPQRADPPPHRQRGREGRTARHRSGADHPRPRQGGQQEDLTLPAGRPIGRAH